MPLTETAYAKINLALHIRRRRDDGYHELETLFAFSEDGDRLKGEVSEDLALTIQGPFASGLSSGSDNLVLRAAETLRAAHGLRKGATLTLDKRLPIAAGIGGGSADAAAALRLLCRLWGVELPEGLAASLGADVPACIASQTVRGEGTGECLIPVEDPGIAGRPILLVNPLIPCPTGDVFAKWNGVDRGPLGQDWGAGRNDLEPAAMAIVPEINAVIHALCALPGTVLTRMSGSGATCFALFETERARDKAAAHVRREHAEWWVQASNLRGL